MSKKKFSTGADALSFKFSALKDDDQLAIATSNLNATDRSNEIDRGRESLEDFLESLPSPKRHKPPSKFVQETEKKSRDVSNISLTSQGKTEATDQIDASKLRFNEKSFKRVHCDGDGYSISGSMLDPSQKYLSDTCLKTHNESECEKVVTAHKNVCYDKPSIIWPFDSGSCDDSIIRTDKPPLNPLNNKLPLFCALFFASISIIVVLPLPMPDLAKGLILGCAIMSVIFFYMYYEFIACSPIVIHYLGANYSTDLLSKDEGIASGSPRRIDGFLNESWNYQVDKHHLNNTFTVYAVLDGCQLTLRRPQQPLPKRILFSDEKIPIESLKFVNTRQFDLRNSQLRLLPEGLVRKRLWSKKYPLSIQLPASSCDNQNESKKSSFVEVHSSDCEQSEIFLFARSSRDKELWYRRLHAACEGLPQPEALFRTVLGDSCPRQLGEQAKNYLRYIGSFKQFADISDEQPGSAEKPELNFINAFLLRTTWDMFRSSYWEDIIKAKIDARLKKIHLPYFIEELSITEFFMGNTLPTIKRLHKPYMNERGLWCLLDIDYSGGCTATLVTRLNLQRLQQKAEADKQAKANSESDKYSSPISRSNESLRMQSENESKTAATSSDLEDSGESSTDESDISDGDSDSDDPALGSVGGKNSRKVIKFIDRVAHSDRFHSLLGKYKFLQKAVNSVSNTKILLSVDVHSLRGTLALNFPFPPSDRMWAGFRPVPDLVLTARPKIGEKEFTARKISDLISRKLISEFYRVFVLPNMEDLYLPTLTSDDAVLAAIPPQLSARDSAASF